MELENRSVTAALEEKTTIPMTILLSSTGSIYEQHINCEQSVFPVMRGLIIQIFNREQDLKSMNLKYHH